MGLSSSSAPSYDIDIYRRGKSISTTIKSVRVPFDGTFILSAMKIVWRLFDDLS